MPNTNINRRITISRRVAVIPPWTPAALPGLELWVKSDTGVSLSGSNVEEWADQSGNSNNFSQVDIAAQPLFESNVKNGLPGITFDGVTQFLKTSTFTLGQPETVFIFFKVNSWTSADSIFDGFTANTGRLLQFNSSPELDQYAGSFGAITTDLPVSSFGLVTSIYNGTSSILQVNDLTETSGDSGSADMDGMTLGCFGGGGGNSHITVCEVIVTSTEATTEQRALVKAYIADRYGM